MLLSGRLTLFALMEATTNAPPWAGREIRAHVSVRTSISDSFSYRHIRSKLQTTSKQRIVV
jgi:hypothetical protein